MKKNVKITIEYDGTDFVGWQRQPNGRTVQEQIENALEKVFSKKITVIGAGRTDSGVHARGQVANFKVESDVDLHELKRSINGLTGEDIVIRSIEEVDENFSARHSAKMREYCYQIIQEQTALERRFFWLLNYPLNIDVMNRAAAVLVGSHDFSSFCRSESSTDHFFCQVFSAVWSEGKPSKLFFTIQANRYLHGMVRALVGTMVDVGRGFITLQDFENVLASKERQRAGQSAPAHGLFLERVVY
jgi:tRNA pseudouridine38-40 synthase